MEHHVVGRSGGGYGAYSARVEGRSQVHYKRQKGCYRSSWGRLSKHDGEVETVPEAVGQPSRLSSKFYAVLRYILFNQFSVQGNPRGQRRCGFGSSEACAFACAGSQYAGQENPEVPQSKRSNDRGRQSLGFEDPALQFRGVNTLRCGDCTGVCEKTFFCLPRVVLGSPPARLSE